MDQLQQQALMTAVSSVDHTWWQLRQQLDGYFDTMADYWQSFKSALAIVKDYTSCSVPFANLKTSYQFLAQAREAARISLRKTWSRTSLLVGLLASQFVDADMLKVFAQWDLRDVRVENMDLGRVQRKDEVGKSMAALQLGKETLLKI
ncbi:unnamed protein product [Symbiodinium natans]|uniref:Uncharacterized protein n=1 Tax=Symbiodinium natans TaxID=878477 RepID=A0A812UZ32_9DINO|nr:unnamed protein product [Symbiodinium natans]